MELSLGLFFGNQGQIGQPLSEEISLLKCSSRSKQKILGLLCDRSHSKSAYKNGLDNFYTPTAHLRKKKLYTEVHGTVEI